MLERTLITSIALVLVLTLAMFLAAFVHADLGLRRVVERPLPPPWPIVGVWRLVDPVREER